MIKNALSVLPARPIIFIVPLMVVMVLSFYYWDKYSRCTDNQQFRASLNSLLQTKGRGSQFRLTEVTRFAWDRVRIVTDFDPERKGGECPFGWNWSEGERDSLIATGLLTVMIFVNKGAIVEYLELRGDEVVFRGLQSSLRPNAAVFGVGNSDAGFTLTLQP